MPDPNFDSDRKLVCAAIDKEAWAIEELALRLKCIPRILSAQNVRRGRPFQEHDLADLVQSVVVIVLQGLPAYEARGPFEGWIYRICMFEFLNSIRRNHRLPDPEDDMPALLEKTGLSAQPSDSFEFEGLHMALAVLNPEERALVEMKHFEGLTFEQIGARMHIPFNTAKTRYYRALRRLRISLEKLTSEEE